MQTQLTETEPTGPQATSPDRATEFVPVEGGADTTSAEALLVTAYVAMWIAVFLFVWLTSRRQRNLDARLGDVETALQRLEDAPEGRTTLGDAALDEGHGSAGERSPA